MILIPWLGAIILAAKGAELRGEHSVRSTLQSLHSVDPSGNSHLQYQAKQLADTYKKTFEMNHAHTTPAAEAIHRRNWFRTAMRLKRLRAKMLRQLRILR